MESTKSVTRRPAAADVTCAVIRLSACAVVSALLVAGCGGGGGSSAENSAQNSVQSSPQNLQTAKAPSQPMNVTSGKLTATDASGNTWTATYSSAPGGMATFNGQSANTSVIALTVSKNGVTAVTEDSTAYYLSNPYSPLGLSGTTSGVSFRYLTTGYTPFPSTLKVGGSGPGSSGTYYDAAGNVIGSLTQTYTVTADSPNALFLNVDAAGSINGAKETETITYSVTASGVPTLVKLQISVNGTTLTFQ